MSSVNPSAVMTREEKGLSERIEREKSGTVMGGRRRVSNDDNCNKHRNETLGARR